MRILLIYTGGTIGMIRTEKGFVPGAGVVEAAIADMTAGAGADIDIETLDPLIDSAAATPETWMRIAHCVEAARDYAAVIITHGTDTLAFTAGALSLALAGLQKPVVITGAMRPLTVSDSDGRRNLRDAVHAAQSLAPGVWVQFAGRTLHGARLRKVHSTALDLFRDTPGDAPPLFPGERPAVNALSPRRVGVFSVYPGACIDLLDHMASHCDGIVLNCYGAGTAPDAPGLRAALETARLRDAPVIAVSQCGEGGIDLGVYAASGPLREAGVIDGRDITQEMAYVKLHFGLSKSEDARERRAFLARSQCGEMRSD